MDRLSTVHDAVREASQEIRPDSQNLKPATYKVDEKIKEKASWICEHNGTTLSGYLRWCCMLLVRDYFPDRKSGSDDLPVLPSGKIGE